MAPPTLLTLPVGHAPGDPILVLAHGAGTDMRHRFLEAFASGVAASGLAVVRFDFPYTAAGKRRPDPPAILEARWREVILSARGDEVLRPRVLFGAGKSMGGRIASHVAAADAGAFAGLVFLGYPLHPVGKPEVVRDAHLPRAAQHAPLLFVSGTRDDLCPLADLEPVLARLGDRAALHVIPDANHSFEVPKRSGRTAADVMAELVSVTVAFVRAHA